MYKFNLYFQGLNAIDACVTAGVKHVIFNGSENIKKHIGKECGHLDSKAAIEEYIKEVGKEIKIPLTFCSNSLLYRWSSIF